MIINVDKQQDKISSIFPETRGWRWTHMKTRYSLITHAVSLQRILYWPLKMNPASWSEPRSNHCGLILRSMGPLVYKTHWSGRCPVHSRVYNCGLNSLNCMKVYVVDTHYGCQVVSDGQEW